MYTTSSTSNRLTAIDNPVRNFGHDAAGNTTSDSGNYTATYNLPGRLATLTKSGVTTSFAYDGFGRRVLKTGTSAGAAKVVFVYDQEGQLLGEYDANGKALREYVWLGSLPVAMFTPDAVTSNPPRVYFIHADHLGAPRVVFDQNNAVRWRWLAEPFGTTAPETDPSGLGAFTQNLRFPGQYADSETGLFYNYFRDYDASIGRYVQSDPIGLVGGINTYAYVGGNPVSRVDPDGRLFFAVPIVWWGVGAIGVGAAAWWASTTPPKMSLPTTPAAPYCKVDELDKKLCDENYDMDRDACFDKFGNGFKGGAFESNLRGCLAWAEVRRNACYGRVPSHGVSPQPGQS